MLITVKDLVKRFGDLVALDHFNFHLKEGEILGLLGPNGSGKTTLVNCILGILSAEKGTIEIFGKPMSSTAYDIKANIGLVPQEIGVLEALTVRENIDYFCGLYVEDSAKRKAMVDDALDFVELNKYEKFLPKKLSGGLKRRLNIACGIAHKPKLLFLDEPTVAVDAQSRAFILEGIKELNRQGCSVVYTTHYLEEVEQICTRIVIMDKGKNLVDGTADELKEMIQVSEKIHAQIVNDDDTVKKRIESIPHVLDVTRDGDNYVVRFRKIADNLAQFVEFLNENGLIYSKIYTELPSLNDVFLELTGKGLRDG